MREKSTKEAVSFYKRFSEKINKEFRDCYVKIFAANILFRKII